MLESVISQGLNIMAARIEVSEKIWSWAIRRSQQPKAELLKNIPQLASWIKGETRPTIRQLENFAKKTYTPFGYLFLNEPPEEDLALPDYRTVDGKRARTSPHLIDTVHEMQRRQEWMRDEMIYEGQDPLGYIGSVALSQSPKAVADDIRSVLQLDFDWASRYRTWENAFVELRQASERAGVLVFLASVVGANTKRPLDPQEFRGFVLVDEYAPVVFVNSRDAKSAQMFTLAHELAHLWIGKSSLFNLKKLQPHSDAVETFCNAVAAEFLVPADRFRVEWKACTSSDKIQAMSKHFRVSPLVIARRALDLELMSLKAFYSFYRKDQSKWLARRANQRKNKNGSAKMVHAIQDLRLGHRFGWAVVCAAREGRLLYRDAYQLTGLRGASFSKYCDRLNERFWNEHP